MAVVDVYWLETDRADGVDLLSILSDDERARAGQFHFERDRHRYVVRHAVLRELLASYLDCAPERIAFTQNHYGKLSVAGSDLRFNLSHSHGIALYAVTRGIEVGCDIERRDPEFAAEQIPEWFFSREETRALRALPLARQTEGFFNCWTRKEAYIKARGYGLSLPLDSFDVSLVPGAPAVLGRGCAGWSVRSFEPLPDFEAAVVAAGAGWELRLHGAELPRRAQIRAA